ncbi:hypothetical protein LZD49_35130 [Dyadobacter sp. CY261]|uniref:hypothetical protein n=1 Tax=Dyadobacter sp. CY261 TaxID=2907203 RepID=UPI001F328CB7|nr:hypothetical protein [Dyadobacter sp. CY261]MCF0075757.1 hypothetical protein [Dyadobacter sp. CY261]
MNKDIIPMQERAAGRAQGLERQEKFIENYLAERRKQTGEDKEEYFLPNDGCAGPEAVELNDDIVIIIVDSQWWLTDWDKDYKINEGCAIKNRATFSFVFENMLRKYKNKNVVIAMHHPPYTYGPHGGAATWRQHIFPLVDIDPELYIPLPILGSLGVLLRGSIGSRQDTPNKYYKDLREGLLAGARKNGSFIFASGHEHALEYIERSGQKFIVSGSGSKVSLVKLGKGSEFAAGKPGYSMLSIYQNGETWTQFWELNAEGTDATLVFQKKIKDKPNPPDIDTLNAFTEYNAHADSSIQHITINKPKPAGRFHNFMLGEHHRQLYLEKYPFPVLDMYVYKGGVKAVKQGGGNQTNSLRVRRPSAASRDYAVTARKGFTAKAHFGITPICASNLARATIVHYLSPLVYSGRLIMEGFGRKMRSPGNGITTMAVVFISLRLTFWFSQ